MDFLLFPMGSHGDVHPLVGMGARLKERGHDVTIITSDHFRGLIQRVGLPLVPMGTDEEFVQMIRDPDLWHPSRGFHFVVRHAMLAYMRFQYDLIAERYRPGRTVVIGSMLGLGARMAHDKLGVPLVTVHLQPAVLWSEYQSPVLGPLLVGPGVPRWMKRFQYWLAAKLIVDPAVLPEANKFRAELGLAPVRRAEELWHSPERVLGMFPDWFGPPQPDWPPNVSLAGFPLWDERSVTAVAPEVEQFLAEGEAPIVFTAGSAMVQGKEFFEQAIKALGLLGRPGILLGRAGEQIPAMLPAGVRHFAYVPFSQVLPRAAALVHHGGIGTASQGLAAGIPHLVMPMSHDQPDNAARLRRLGVAAVLRPREFRAPAVAQALAGLLDSPQVQARCRQIAGRFQGVDALDNACLIVEEMPGGP